MDSYTHDRRHSEPENVYNITLSVLAEIMAKGEKRYNEKNTNADNDGRSISEKG